jgi:hypothetical protein
MTRRCAHWFARRNCRIGKFYSHLFQTGFQNWFILPLQQCSPLNADILERRWIAKLGARLNTKDTPRFCRQYQLLLGAKVLNATPPNELLSTAQRIIAQRRCTVPLPQQLDVLAQGKRVFNGQFRSKLYQSVKLRVEQATELKLPACVSLKVPSMPFDSHAKLRKLMVEFLHHLPIPLPYRHYLSSVLQVLYTRPQSVSSLISHRRIRTSLSEARHLGSGTCDCVTIAQEHGFPLTQGHIIARAPWMLHQLFGRHAPILLQNVNNEVAPTWEEVHTQAIQSLRKILCNLLPNHLDLAVTGSHLYSAVLSELKSLWKAAIACTPWYLKSGPIRAFKNSARRWIFLPCDKNTGRIMTMCPVLYFRSIDTLYSDPMQFAVLHEYPSLPEAHQAALDQLWTLVVKYDLARYWKSGKTKSAPVSFCLPKNKSDEFLNILKWRILFSHYRHPMRWYGRLIGRCLTLLINLCPYYLPSLEMPHTKDLLSAVRYWNTRLQEHSTDPRFADLAVTFWELDVKDMSPSLDRTSVYDAIIFIHDAIWEKLVNVRIARGKCMVFFINRFDKHLDRVGCGGDAKLFHKITFDDVKKFVKFDLEANDIFLLGSTLMRQLRGVAIGGTCSAPLACAYCIQRENLYYQTVRPFALHPVTQLHPLHLPAQPVRFRDNLEGLKFEGQDILTLQQSFEGMYNLNLQVEGEGPEWDSLQCHMRIHRTQTAPQISLTLADKGQKFTKDHQRLYRYPDRHCAKAMRTLRSLVPSQAKWATYFRILPSDMQSNIEVIKNEMTRKGYATSRWKPQLKRNLSKWGVDKDILHACDL